MASSPSRRGRLTYRPGRVTDSRGEPRGIVDLGDSGSHRVFGYVPPERSNEPLRLFLLLHGAGGHARNVFDRLVPFADDHRLLVVAPHSLQATWDVIGGSFGPDVHRIDQLLGEVSARYPVNALTIAGFSDGASYALSLGIGNGDVFDSVVAFSPGFVAPAESHGRPLFFVSHGTQDQVLPIDLCSRRLVPQLEEAGYDVTYHEFEGGHAMPEDVVSKAVTWVDQL